MHSSFGTLLFMSDYNRSQRSAITTRIIVIDPIVSTVKKRTAPVCTGTAANK